MTASRSDGCSRYPHANKAIDIPTSNARWGLAQENCQLLAQEEILDRKPLVNRERIASSSWGQKRDHRPLLPYPHPRVIG
jgi:hypothetical protein